MHEQNSIFKYTTMGPTIPKEMKYNLHYGDVRGDVLSPLAPAAVKTYVWRISKKRKKEKWKKKTYFPRYNLILASYVYF